MSPKKKKKRKMSRGARRILLSIAATLFVLIAAVAILVTLEFHRERIGKWVQETAMESDVGPSPGELDRFMARLDGHMESLLADDSIVSGAVRTRRSDAGSGNLRYTLIQREVSLADPETAGALRRDLEAFARQYPAAALVERKVITGDQVRTTLSVRYRGLLMRELTLASIAKPKAVRLEQPRGPRVAIIVDDVGANIEPLMALLSLEAPLTYAILPSREFSAEAQKMIRKRGKEVMLHLPMEPLDYPRKNPGKGALMVRMGEEEIRKQVRRFLDEFPGVAGVNNHMGSRFTQDRRQMGVVLDELKRRNLFFVDSLTIGRSVAHKESARLGLPYAKRDVFLDHVDDPKRILEQVEKMIQLAKRNGSALAICHPRKNTIAVLRKAVQRLKSEGIDVVPVSTLIGRS